MYGTLPITGVGITPLIYLGVGLIVGGALLVRAAIKRGRRNRKG